jgi:hypothetical protein
MESTLQTGGQKSSRPKRGYWYKYFTNECVLCWGGETWKERQYTPKPKDPAERYSFEQFAHDSHFL